MSAPMDFVMDSPAEVHVPVIQNIVSTVDLGCKLDLPSITSRARNAEYKPKRFSAVVMRIREPKTTALIFASGKMVITGAKTEQDSRIAARKYARILQKLGSAVKFNNFKIQNIVGSCDLKFTIRLESLAFDHAKYAVYEPEIFPGLIYTMAKSRIKVLVFVSGKIVIAGAKVKEEVFRALDYIYSVLQQYKKVQETELMD